MRPALASLLAPLALLVVTALPGPGCTSDRASPECKEVCRKHARCAEEQRSEAATGPAAEQSKFDQSECIGACTSLQRDREGRRLVAQHLECVERAKDACPALLACH
ncbi:MAG TPA: hypothetical protein VKB80_02325 [Kofleriaceae bacterium]|nr:hypothetical protein [Kofleriaceae bacterium]